MPAPTIEAIPVAVRPTRPMLRTNLALAKAGPGPEHPRDASCKDSPHPPVAPRRRPGLRRRTAALPDPGADRLPPSGALRHRAHDPHLVTGREARRLSLERPGASRTGGLAREARRNRPATLDRASHPTRRLGGGVATRAAAPLSRVR